MNIRRRCAHNPPVFLPRDVPASRAWRRRSIKNVEIGFSGRLVAF